MRLVFNKQINGELFGLFLYFPLWHSDVTGICA